MAGFFLPVRNQGACAQAWPYTAPMLWVKAFHIVFVASWFAGLFYLPRIFVNLAMVPPESVAERERLLLLLAVGYHHACAGMLRRFVAGQSRRSHVWYRWFNELPVLLLVIAVVLVVVKPF